MFQLPVESDSDAACLVGGEGKERDAQELNLPLTVQFTLMQCSAFTPVQCSAHLKHISCGPEVQWMQGVQDRKSM